ncbi:MAG: sensor domain-containing diguanylate cyclase [Acidobacteria bacterium]|nr:sensor domain-containing diguanylate cyclase [Acidobacteriota bacterium]
MQRPSLPLDESTRLDALRSLAILDTPAEERFDRVTRLAHRVFDAPVIALALVDSTRVWFKSSCGIAFPQLARDVSFAGHAIHASDTFVVEDTRKDPRFSDNPLVTAEPFVRFYAAQPLTTVDGSVVGVLELLDQRTRSLSERDIADFRDLARIAETELRNPVYSKGQEELLREDGGTAATARIDPLTRLWSRGAVVDILQRELSHARRDSSGLGMLLVDVDHLRDLNATNGHEAGDAALQEIVRRIRTNLRPYDSVGRFGGEEFLIVLPGTDREGTILAGERIRIAVEKEELSKGIAMSVSIGAAAAGPAASDSAALIRLAEHALSRAKSLGGNRVA